MNKAELIDQIADRLGADKRAANNAVEAVLDTITRAVAAGEKVAITGFGVFEKQVRKARTGRNPQTGAVVKIKATSVPKFRPASTFKEVVSGAKKLAKATPLVTAAAAAGAASSGRAAAKKATGGARKTTKTAAKKSPAKTSTAKRGTAKKSTAKKSTAKKAARR
ncbi:MAG: HU family DNA-binding protein [Actinomycetes bacterium]